MTKRKPTGEDGNTIRKKRQAFGAPKDGATKAKSKHNETQSCFAKLPREVRRSIWRYVLGDEVLHIHRHDPPNCVMFDKYNECQWKGTRPWELVVCKDSRTPSKLYQLSKTSEDYRLPTSEHYERCAIRFPRCMFYGESKMLQRSTVFCHYDCSGSDGLRGFGKDVPDNWGQNLNLLRTCRMIYHEANHVLWTTNTFSFKTVDAFSAFMGDRSTLQMQLITKLQFILIDSNLDILRKWIVKTSHTTIKKLRSLKEVHFCLSDVSLKEYKQDEILVEQNYLGGPLGVLKSEVAKFIGNFRIHAPLRDATVIMDNRFDRKELQRLSHSQRLDWAEELRTCLLDPEGAAKWQAERDVELAELAQKIEANKAQRKRMEEIDRETKLCEFPTALVCAHYTQERQDAKDARERRKRKTPFVAQPCIYGHLEDEAREKAERAGKEHNSDSSVNATAV